MVSPSRAWASSSARLQVWRAGQASATALGGGDRSTSRTGRTSFRGRRPASVSAITVARIGIRAAPPSGNGRSPLNVHNWRVPRSSTATPSTAGWARTAMASIRFCSRLGFMAGSS